MRRTAKNMLTKRLNVTKGRGREDDEENEQKRRCRKELGGDNCL